MKAIYPGAGQWCSSEGLNYMAAVYGQARSLPSLNHTCMAAQKRVYLWEDKANGGLAVRSRYDQLKRACRDSDHFDRFAVWNDWYLNGPITTLFRNSTDLEDMGLGSRKLLSMAGWDAIDPGDRTEGMRRVKKNTQKITCRAIAKHGLPDSEGRIRKKWPDGVWWVFHGLQPFGVPECSRTCSD